MKWEDIDFEAKEITPMRSIVKQHVGDVKTEASKKQIPLDDVLVAELLAWRNRNALRCETVTMSLPVPR